ncbi:response regulator transcription factor [Sulfurimonas sp. SAG-AH-194-C21]|nr:response regulator transcription factor [Sulfurimonas sp. SAG-AH-194-C21]MDF1882567.1 response regulator transcription factor [Sulfurimonas sp. SAG-AH-194-C21]
MKILKQCNILLLEDDKEFASNLVQVLELYFQTVYFKTNISDALAIVQKEKIDVIISDIHLEKENGLDFIATLRKEKNDIPIIIFSGFKDEKYLFKAIELGVIDYIVKPFDLKRLEEVLSRYAQTLSDKQDNTYQIKNNMYFDMDKKILYEDDKEVTLTAKEYLFLAFAIEKKSYILTREMIESAVYGQELMSIAALKNLLFRIRKKLGKEFITTLPELGYKINI